MRNHFWPARDAVLHMDCEKAGAELGAIERRNDAEHWPGWHSCLVGRRLEWDLTDPVLGLLPSGFYTWDSAETDVHSWSQICPSIQHLLWSRQTVEALSDLLCWIVTKLSFAATLNTLYTFISHLTSASLLCTRSSIQHILSYNQTIIVNNNRCMKIMCLTEISQWFGENLYTDI